MDADPTAGSDPSLPSLFGKRDERKVQLKKRNF